MIFRRFPYTTLNDINLDWIIKQVKQIAAALQGKQDKPDLPGVSGQVLGLDDNLDPVWLDNGGGGGGTTNYNSLSNKPQINSVTLTGNKTAADLGLAAASDIPAVPVQSVNGKTGAVELDAADVGALPSDTFIPVFSMQLPVMDGEASAGTTYTRYSMEGHVHPHDTSKVDAPATTGTAGQVLSLTSTGTQWIDRITDSGWFDLSNYVNTSIFSVRPGSPPKIRIINGVMYFSGEIYITTTPSDPGNAVMAFTDIPTAYRPSTQISAAGLTYGSLVKYFIYQNIWGSISITSESYASTDEYHGFSLSMLSGNLQ